MSANPVQMYDLQKDKSQIFPTYNAVTQSQFETVGHPGKWDRSVAVLNTTVDFTGSNYGAGAVFITQTSTNATASLSAGGTVLLGNLPTGIHELGVSQVVSVDATKTVYVLINTEGF